jgi:hypothetical protein
MNKRNAILRDKARRSGANYCLAIIEEARRAGLPISLGFALIEQESGFRNVFGHDPTIFAGAGNVTKTKYLAYKRARGHTRMQGVGPAQLTWWEYQDSADRLGGCWVARNNIRVGFELLAALVDRHGEREGLAIYNGGSRNPNHRYAQQVLDRRRKWHNLLT